MVLLIAYVFFFKNNHSPIQKENVLQQIVKDEKESGKEESEEESPDNRKEEIKVSPTSEQVLPCEQNIKETGEWIDIETEVGKLWTGRQIRMNSIEITKTFLDTDARAKVGENNGLFGEDGTILKPFSYIVANITIINPTEEERGVGISTIHCVLIDKESGDRIYPEYDEDILQGNVLGYKTLADELQRRRKDYFTDPLRPGEELTCNLVFIMRDEALEAADAYIELNTSGTIPDFDTIFFRVK